MPRTRNRPKPKPMHHRYTAGRSSLDHMLALVREVRPEWDEYVVRAVLADLAPRVDGSDLAVASIRAACDATFSSPKAIGWAGPHWRDLSTAPAAVTGGPRCSTCGKTEARCLGERPGLDDDHQFEPVTTS